MQTEIKAKVIRFFSKVITEEAEEDEEVEEEQEEQEEQEG